MARFSVPWYVGRGRTPSDEDSGGVAAPPVTAYIGHAMQKPKPPHNADDPAQSRRFIKAAQEAEADDPAEDADAILRKLADKERTTPPTRKPHSPKAS